MPPRILPWLKTPKSESKPHVTPSKRPRTQDPPSEHSDGGLDLSGLINPVRREPVYQNELPSSPTALDALSEREVVYMQEGFDADDGWVMVEDEFFSTAQLFTRHLHHEEYVRLKKLARSRMADAAESTIRGVDAITKQSGQTKVKLQTRERQKTIKQSMKSTMVEDSGSKDTYLSTLMSKKTWTSVDLDAMVSSKVNTKAATGIKQELDASLSAAIPHKNQDSDLEDLGAHLEAQTSHPGDALKGSFGIPPAAQTSRVVKTEPAASGTTYTAPVESPKKTIAPQGDVPDTSERTSAASQFLERRKAALEKKRQSQHYT